MTNSLMRFYDRSQLLARKAELEKILPVVREHTEESVITELRTIEWLLEEPK